MTGTLAFIRSRQAFCQGPSRTGVDEEEEVSYEMLQELVRQERRSNKLSIVPASFWSKVRQFLSDVTGEFRAQQEKDPWARTTMLLSDEVKNAKHAAENLWTLRERKLAMLALAKNNRRPDGVTPVEGELYDNLKQLLGDKRTRVFEGTVAQPAAQAPPPQPRAPTPTETPAPQPATPEEMPAEPAPIATAPPAPAATPAPTTPPAPPSNGPAPTGEPEPAATEPDAPPPEPPTVPSGVQGEEESVMIRALSEIPPFVGPDMQTYVLQEGDVAAVPPSIAKILAKRNKATIVKET